MKYIRNQEFMNKNIVISDKNFGPTTQIVFIDSQVEDYQTLATGVVSGIEVVVLDYNKNSISDSNIAMTTFDIDFPAYIDFDGDDSSF